MQSSIIKTIQCARVIAVVTVDDADTAVPMAETLCDAGIGAIELTLRTEAAISAIEAVRKSVPNLLVGAGTVLTTEQAKRVKDSGAHFAVAPGLNPCVVAAAKDLDLPFAPGVATPSDIEAAVEIGCKILKFFPAEPIGGLGYLRAMATPYQHLGLQFIPLGGLNANNAAEYLDDPLVCAIGGSWIAKTQDIRDRNWKRIRELAAEAIEIANAVTEKPE